MDRLQRLNLDYKNKNNFAAAICLDELRQILHGFENSIRRFVIMFIDKAITCLLETSTVG